MRYREWMVGAAVAMLTGPLAEAADRSADGWVEALAAGEPALDLRLRYEHAGIGDLRDGNAITLRPRLGYATGDFHGFDAFGEYEGVYALGGDDDYNSGPPFLDNTNGNTEFATIADPTGDEVNQAWLRYRGIEATEFKAGRQRIIYDNARFIGNVGWRNDEQTFDAVRLTAALAEDVSFDYAYVWRQNFIFFNDNRLNTHFINLGYEAGEALELSAYTYLIDFDEPVGPNAAPRAPGAPDQRTSGVRVSGAVANIGYALEYANQGDYGDAPDSVDADYYLAELSYSAFGLVPVIGWEVATGDGDYAFQFPLATNHAYFGWADVFLSTPADGLRDAYAGLGYTLGPLLFKAVYHDFEAEDGGVDYGEEIDVLIAYTVNDELSLLAKYADYQADAFAADVERFWLQATYAF